MSIITRQETKDVFVCSDGVEFLTMRDAQEHESQLRKVKYFKVFAYPDLTEGRHGPKHVGYIEVVADIDHVKFAEYSCYKLFGNKVTFVQGVYGSNAVMPAWSFSESKEPEGKLVATFQERFCSLKKHKEGFTEK